MTILYAVSDRIPGRQLAGLCIAFLLALWIAFSIWKWRSGAVWAFSAMINGSFAAILLYHIVKRQSNPSLPPPLRSDFIRLLLRVLMTTARLCMGFYSFAKGPIRCHFGLQCAFSLFEIVQSAAHTEMRLMKDKSDKKRAEATSNKRRSVSWMDSQSQQSLFHRDQVGVIV